MTRSRDREREGLIYDVIFKRFVICNRRINQYCDDTVLSSVNKYQEDIRIFIRLIYSVLGKFYLKLFLFHFFDLIMSNIIFVLIYLFCIKFLSIDVKYRY